MTQTGEATVAQPSIQDHPEEIFSKNERGPWLKNVRGTLALLFLIVSTPVVYGLVYLAFLGIFGGS